MFRSVHCHLAVNPQSDVKPVQIGFISYLFLLFSILFQPKSDSRLTNGAQAEGEHKSFSDGLEQHPVEPRSVVMVIMVIIITTLILNVMLTPPAQTVAGSPEVIG